MERSLVPAWIPSTAIRAAIVAALTLSAASAYAAEPMTDVGAREPAAVLTNGPAPDAPAAARDPEQAVIRMNGLSFTAPEGAADPDDGGPSGIVIRFGRSAPRPEPLTVAPTATTDRHLVIVFGGRRSGARCTS